MTYDDENLDHVCWRAELVRLICKAWDPHMADDEEPWPGDLERADQAVMTLIDAWMVVPREGFDYIAWSKALADRKVPA